MSEKKYTVLFLCTGNSARSIMAEAILNHLGKGRFRAYSAGSYPTGKVNPFALQLLQKMGLPTENLQSKSWNGFAKSNTPQLDFIFTVCDNAAGEICPIWPGKPITAHWGVEDPAVFNGSDEKKQNPFRDVALILRRRIELFIGLPIDKLDSLALRDKLKEIGKN